MQLTGQIQQIIQGVTGIGLPRWQVVVNGAKYGTLEDPQAAVGDMVSFVAEQRGQWLNARGWVKAGSSPVVGASVAGDTGPPAQPPTTATFVPPSPFQGGFRGGSKAMDPEREARIVRQNSNSSAIALLDVFCRANPDHMVNRTLEDILVDVEWLGRRLFKISMEGYSK